MNLQFNTNPSFLASRLFTPDRPRIGANTFLNVNVLPDFVQYIKRNLKQQELIALSEYQLQTYIMQLSIKEKVTQSLDSFVQKILTYVRTRKQFWINGIIVGSHENQEKQKQQQKHQHEAIIQYHKDIQQIQNKIPNYPQKVFNNRKKRRIHLFMSTLKTDFIDKTKQVMKLNITNYAMMPAYVLREYLKNQNQKSNLPNYDDLEKNEINLLKILENAAEYFLMQQKPRNLKNQQVKRRQIVRQRRLPAHLMNNISEPIQQEQKNDDEASFYSKQSHEVQSLHFHEQQNKLEQMKVKNIPQNQNQKIIEESSQNSQSSSEEEENKLYLNFHSLIAKKQFYDSKMFSKQPSINQSHNIMQILKCLIYFYNKKEDQWFDRKWKELEEERILRQQRKKKEQESEQNLQNNESQNQKIDENEKIICQNENKKEQNQQIIQNGNQSNNILQHSGQNNKNQTNQQKNSNQNIQQSQESNQNENKKEQKPQIIEIGIRKPIFNQLWKNPQIWSYKRLSKHLSDRFLTMREIYFVTKEFVSRQIITEFNHQKQIFTKKQQKFKRLQDGLLDPQGTNLDQILLEFKQMIQHPENVKLGSFKTQGIKIPWDDSDYLMFLKGLRQYFFIPTNNRKIAQFMMSKSNKKIIEANHVKYVKAIYLKNMQVRIDRGQSGGGKKGKMLGKTQFIDKDIESFSMRWFDKMKKSKKKLRRRRFEDDEGLGQEADSAY